MDGQGRIYAVGGSDGEFHIARLTATGQLDITFGGGGLVDVPVTPNPPDPSVRTTAIASRVFVAADGTATIGGGIDIQPVPPIPDANFSRDAVVGLTPDGVPDPTFAEHGIWIAMNSIGGLSDLSVDDSGHTIVTDADYEYFGGFTKPGVYRLNPDGSPDTSFGPDGRFDLPIYFGAFGSHDSMAVQMDGKIVVALPTGGRQDPEATILRIDPNAPPHPSPITAISGDSGIVKSYRPDDVGDLTFDKDITPFPGFTGQVRVATADFTGDGVADFVYATGPGRADLRVVDGATGADLLAAITYSPYESSFTGGLFVAAADIDHDGVAELVVSPDIGGGPRVQIFSLTAGTLVQKDNFFGIDDPTFRGGARVAVGDLNGDGMPDLDVGEGDGGGSRVALFDGKGLLQHHGSPIKLTGDLFAFPDNPDFRGGVFVAAGDVDGDGVAEMAFGAGDGGGPRVLLARLNGEHLADFFSDDATFRGGAHIAIKDSEGDGIAELIVGSGTGTGDKVQIFSGLGLSGFGTPSQELSPFGKVLPNGVYVG